MARPKTSRRFPRIEPINSDIGDDVGYVAFVLHFYTVLDHQRVVVVALTGQDVPVVKSLGVACLVVSEVPCTNYGGVVSGRFHQLLRLNRT